MACPLDALCTRFLLLVRSTSVTRTNGMPVVAGAPMQPWIRVFSAPSNNRWARTRGSGTSSSATPLARLLAPRLSLHHRRPPTGFTALEDDLDAAPPVVAELSESPRTLVRLTRFDRRKPSAHRSWRRSSSPVGTAGSADGSAGLQSTHSIRCFQGVHARKGNHCNHSPKRIM